jgi:ATP-binding cassette subfamily C protein
MTRDKERRSGQPNGVSSALASCRGAFLSVALITSVVSLLYLTGAFFMLEVYDRVVPSRNVPTLVALVLLAGLLFAFQGFLDVVRMRILVRIGGALDAALSRRAFNFVVRQPLQARQRGDGMQPVRDLDQVRGFLSGLGPTAFFDLPWLPIFLGVCFVFHPLIGLTALIGAILLVALTLLTEILSKKPAMDAASHARARNAFAEAGRRNAEALHVMGMARRFEARYGVANARFLESQRRVSDVTGGLGATSKMLRLALQSAVLGVGALVVIRGEATPGVMIAGAILSARALAPVELAIGHWKGFIAARQSWRRLKELAARLPEREELMPLPTPSREVTVTNLGVSPPGERLVIVQDASFRLAAGQGLGVIGPSASGKSSLVRALVGAWTPARGAVRIDGAALDQWPAEQLGRLIGYLPQAVELFEGTVGDNIARFDPDATPEAIVAAAQAAGVHDLITRLPEGYQTQIGEGGVNLSAGQRQRVALARALYGEPFLVVLDEPNSNLDVEGEIALTQAMLGVRARGGIVVVVAHRPAALAATDLVLLMVAGCVQAFGPKDEILAKLRPSTVRPAVNGAVAGQAPLRVVAAEGDPT